MLQSKWWGIWFWFLICGAYLIDAPTSAWAFLFGAEMVLNHVDWFWFLICGAYLIDAPTSSWAFLSGAEMVLNHVWQNLCTRVVSKSQYRAVAAFHGISSREGGRNTSADMQKLHQKWQKLAWYLMCRLVFPTSNRFYWRLLIFLETTHILFLQSNLWGTAW